MTCAWWRASRDSARRSTTISVAELAARGVSADRRHDGVVRFELQRRRCARVALDPQLARVLLAADRSVRSGHDPDLDRRSGAAAAGDRAAGAARARGVPGARHAWRFRSARTASVPSAAKTERCARADGVVGVSQYVARLHSAVGRHRRDARADLAAGTGSRPGAGRLRERVRHAGESLRGEGHRDLPGAGGPHARDVRFAAVPTWGTNAARLRGAAGAAEHSAARSGGQHRRPAAPDARAAGAVAVGGGAVAHRGGGDAARRAGDRRATSAGSPKRRWACQYLLPVKPIVQYRPGVDEQMVPVAEVPAQDIGPWRGGARRPRTGNCTPGCRRNRAPRPLRTHGT